ncbi:MAG: hypothetical protein IBX71_01830 [Candidatus Desulforudis sp.]|nr:hypothetical protein [Desulforudis sp.]
MKKMQMSAREAVAKLDNVVSAHLKAGNYLYCAEAGGEVFYTEIDDRLRQLEGDTPVTLVFYTEAELTSVTLIEAQRFVNQVSGELPKIADAFYAGQGSLGTLVQLAEALAWLQEVCVLLSGRGHDLAGWPERLRDAARELVQVTEENRATGQGDFLLYELQGALDGLRDRLARIEVVDGDQA